MPYYCSDCALILNSEAQKSQHYSGRRHHLRVSWLKRKNLDKDKNNDSCNEIVSEDESADGPKHDMQGCWNDYLRGGCDVEHVLNRVALTGGGKLLAVAIIESLKVCAGDFKEIFECAKAALAPNITPADYSLEIGLQELRQIFFQMLTNQIGHILVENDHEGEAYDAFEEQLRRLYFFEEVYVKFSIALVSGNLAPISLLYTQLQKTLFGELIPRSILLERIHSKLFLPVADRSVHIACCLFDGVIKTEQLHPDYQEILFMISVADKKLSRRLKELKKKVEAGSLECYSAPHCD
eukprot:TRINITY_DN7829_c0_g1_i1.p1 TRINITY_DN7829_c0_g1~~TRINITY_DN7829_c0_g1_i1.p1  ORF type:complete len:295 (+),score=37.48 TRINITY_DN7829_c0_g1_i1:37-921(+)